MKVGDIVTLRGRVVSIEQYEPRQSYFAPKESPSTTVELQLVCKDDEDGPEVSVDSSFINPPRSKR